MIEITFNIYHVAAVIAALLSGPAIIIVAYNVFMFFVGERRKKLTYNIEENNRLRQQVRDLGGDPNDA